MSRPAPPPSKFFLEDIVRSTDRDPNGTEDDLAVVLRHWHDSDPATHPPEYRDDPLNRALEQGEVGISYMVSGAHEIVHEKDYYLVDRSLQPGDLVKLSVHDVQSGVVLESRVEVKLEHAVSMAQYSPWVSSEELENATEVYVGDYVIHDDWVGQVEELHDEATAELDSKELFTYPMLGGRFQVGDRGPDVLPEGATSRLERLGMTGTPEVLVFVKATVLAVAWLAVNQALDPSVAEKKERPKQFWTADELKQLSIVRPRAIFRISDRVRFKDASVAEMHGIRNTHHGKEGVNIGLIESDVLVVRETRTTVRVLWQGGAITEGIPATALIPYANPDEYDCWPGDYVLWKGDEGETRAAVVQHVNAGDRTAQVYWRAPPPGPPPTKKPASYSLVSVLELDPHGMSGAASDQPDTIGVRRGDFVFIHAEGTTNGCTLPTVPKIGELEPWVREIDPSGGWRGKMAMMGAEYAQRFEASRFGAVETASGLKFWKDGLEGEHEPRIPWRNPKDIDWFGEVVNLKTSGDVVVNLPSGATKVVPLQRLTLLMDGRDGANAVWVDENGMEVDEATGVGLALNPSQVGMFGNMPAVAQALSQFLGLGVQQPALNLSGGPTVFDYPMVGSEEDDDGSWEDYQSADEVEMAEAQQTEHTASTSPPAPEEEEKGDTLTLKVPAQEAAIAGSMSPGSSAPHSPHSEMEDDDDDRPWTRFKVLASAPQDHAFLTKGSKGQPSRQFMGRLSKEYKLLSTSLPETIVVRAYEDRTDLLRSLIIGPENTPYEGAPFVIDWFLEDTFPATPPQAHFHSWTNGNGRVNPNLYEEGKVCLSILGTWAGDKSECWSPARSSLMQALVSIQGLVLVKEPWFCEPQFENLRGTQEGIVNSRLYSEKAYVLSRGFVRRALEMPPEGLQREIEWMYVEQGTLSKVIADAKALIEASQKSGGTSTADIMRTMPGWEDKAVPKLTAGGVLPVQRTLTKLETILTARTAAAAASAATEIALPS